MGPEAGDFFWGMGALWTSRSNSVGSNLIATGIKMEGWEQGARPRDNSERPELRATFGTGAKRVRGDVQWKHSG